MFALPIQNVKSSAARMTLTRSARSLLSPLRSAHSLANCRHSLRFQPCKCGAWSPSQIDASLREGVPEIEHCLMIGGLSVFQCPLVTDSSITREFSTLVKGKMAPLPCLPAVDEPLASYRFLSLYLSQSLSFNDGMMPS